MKRLVLLAAIALLQRAVAEPPNSTVEGIVRKSGTSDGIASVSVSLNGTSGSALMATTDETGRFVFRNVATGQYRIGATLSGYLRPEKGGGSQTVNITGAAPLSPLELSLIAGGAISGSIVDAAGQPIKGIQVSATQLGYNDGRETSLLAGTNRLVTTDDRGQFRLFWFLPGNYYIRAETSPAVGAAAGPKMVSWYPGTLNADSAVAVSLRAGEEVDGIAFKLEAADSSSLKTVSGKVVLPADTLGSGIVGNLYLFPSDRQTGSDGNGFTILSTNRAKEMSGGNFTLNGVLPGSYDLLAALPASSGARTLSRTSVTVGAKDVDGVVIPLAQTVDLQGSIRMDGPASNVPLASLAVTLTPDHHLQPTRTNSDSSGAFSVRGLAEGKYGIAISGLPATAYVSDIRQSNRSIFAGARSADDAVVTVRSESTPVEVLIRTDGGNIAVSVKDAKDKTVEEATVALVPEEPRRSALLWYKTGSTDNRGQLALTGIAPGVYKVFAWNRIPAGAHLSADFLMDFENSGKRITVDAAGHSDVTVSVIPDDAQPARKLTTAVHLVPAPRDAVIPKAISQGDNATIEGTVKRLHGGAPIANVAVYIGNQSTRSRADGSYTITDVPPGDNSVNILGQPAGFFVPSRDGFPVTVNVKPKEHLENFDLKLLAGGTISGRVIQTNGMPLAGVQLQLEADDYVYGPHYLLFESSAGVPRTDARGEFRMSNVQPGEYYLRVRSAAPDVATTFFPGALDAGHGQRIVVKEDAELTQINITIQPATGKKLSGKITNLPDAGTPLSGSLYLIPNSDVVIDVLDMLTSTPLNRATGEFTVNNVAPGTYDLVALYSVVAPGARNFAAIPDAAYTGKTSVAILDQDVDNVSLTMHPLVDLSGRVEFEKADTALPLDSFRLYFSPMGFSPTATWARGQLKLDPSGQFVAPKMPDVRYRFSVEGVPVDYYISDLRQDNTSVFDSGVLIDGSVPTPVKVVISDRGGNIDGLLASEDQKAVAYAVVALVPESARRQNFQLFKTATTDKDGHFSLRGIAPGEYKLFSWETAPRWAWYNAEFLAPYEEQGTPVHIEAAGSVDNVKVKRIPPKPER